MRSAIAFLLCILAVVGADECGSNDQKCGTEIGKGCGSFSNFWHKCESPTTCNSNHQCECPKNQCAVSGFCVTTTTTTAAPDDAQCMRAYQDRCFEQEPYAMTCCSQCNQGKSNDVCTWSFTETNPKLGFGGEFDMENPDCVGLCEALKEPSNTRYDYCPTAHIQALAKKCSTGKKSLDDNVPKDLCDKTVQVEMECSWTYTRAESASTCGGTPSSSSISGSFLYSYDDHAGEGDCQRACEALADANAEPNGFCSGGSIYGVVSKCPAAQKSLEQAATPTDWCILNFTEPPKVIANSGDLCDDAFRNDCWKQGAFKKCCENCYEDKGYAKCEWSFTGPSVFDGEICTTDGIQLSASFQFESSECFAACSALSTKIKDPQDLCEGSDFRKEIDGCKGAKKSVDQALTTTSWCPASQTKTQDESRLNALFLASDNQCQAAYQKRCYETSKSFSECCAKCSDAQQDYKCHWSFHETTNDFSMRDVFVGMDSKECKTVCKLLNNPENTRKDYCPGSDLYVAAQACPGALANLQKQVPEGFCDHNDKAETACSWTYSYEFRSIGSGETPLDTASGNLTGSITSKFHYSPGNKDCKIACAALGYNNNLPSAYCSGTNVWTVVSKCEPAMASLQEEVKKQPELNKQWCKSIKLRDSPNFEIAAEPMNPPVDPKCRSDKDLHLCDASFNQRCYNNSWGQQGPGRQAFSQCCNDCFRAQAKSTCEWSMDTPGVPLKGEYEYYGSNYQCFNACNIINELKQVTDLCPDRQSKLGKVLQACPWAWNIKGKDPPDAKHRGSVKNEFCNSPLMKSECGYTDAQMDSHCGKGHWGHKQTQLIEINDVKSVAWVAIAFTAMAAAAFVVYKSRKPQDLDGYVQFQAA